MMMLRILNGDALEMLRTLPDESVNCCVTSPPYYGLRDYGAAGQIGLESTPEQYIERLVSVFREVRRVLRNDGTLWVNIGDSYAGGGRGFGYGGKQDTNKGCDGMPKSSIPLGLKPKDLIGIPWMLAFALRADGWYLRQDIIWAKPNPMPESVKDRCTKSHEYIFLLSKSARYYYDNEAIMELATGFDGRKDTKYKGGPKDMAGGAHERWQYKNLQPDGQQPNTMHLNRLEGNEYMSPVRNKRDVWTITTKPYTEAHFATFPPELPRICILAGCPADGVVLDPFAGSGTTGAVALELGRRAVLIELNPKYVKLIERRTQTTVGLAI
ncbi:MAG: site-specific DNA-methyltransferase [Acidobacteria bacterium]|nr:site-specific DNA-methyltransferase [Acidobacteriota bacterium]